MFNNQEILYWVTISFLLVTLMCVLEVTVTGEIRCLSLLKKVNMVVTQQCDYHELCSLLVREVLERYLISASK